MTRVITGVKYNFNEGTVVVLDRECINGDHIRIGEKVSFEGKEYTVDGVIPPPVESDSWSLRLI